MGLKNELFFEENPISHRHLFLLRYPSLTGRDLESAVLLSGTNIARSEHRAIVCALINQARTALIEGSTVQPVDHLASQSALARNKSSIDAA